MYTIDSLDFAGKEKNRFHTKQSKENISNKSLNE